MKPVIGLIEEPADEELRELYTRLEGASQGLGLLNVFKVMAHNPALLRNWLRFATVLLSSGLTLSPRLRELAILRVFQLTGGEYGFAHHVRIGKQAGLTDDEIAALGRYQEDARFSELDRTALRYVDAVTALAPEASELANSLQGPLSEREVLELTFVAAHWTMLARVLQPLQVPVDESLTRELPAGWREWLRRPS